jgi:small-conductance mechanosensitive channel
MANTITYTNIATIMGEWILACVVLLLTFLGTTATRALLKRIHKDRNWPILRQLAPSISNVLYIIGFKITVDVAPLSGKIEVWLTDAIYILAVVIFLNLVQRAALIGIEWSTLKTNNSETLQLGFIPLLRNVITLFVFFSGCIMVLKHFNYDVMSLLTALGVGSLAVGLAAKDTLSNMISGFILIIDRNLRPGDRVNLGGTVGDVQEIGLRSTQIKIGDGNTLIVPNSDLVNTKILNLSLPNRETTCSAQIRVPCSTSFESVKALCLSILSQVSQVSRTKGASVNLLSLVDGHQLIQISFWVNEMNESGSALTEFLVQLLDRLNKENIELLGPTRTAPS